MTIGETLVWAGLLCGATLLDSAPHTTQTAAHKSTDSRGLGFAWRGPKRAFGLFICAMQGASLGLIRILKPAVIASKLGNAAYGAISGWLAVPYLIGGALGPLGGGCNGSAGFYTHPYIRARALK